MLDSIYNFLVDEKDLLGSLAALATVFAVLIPLPIFVISTVLQRRADARERAYAFIEQVDSVDSRALRDQMLAIALSPKFASQETFVELTDEEKNILRAFMNSQEIVGIHLNSSRISDRTFFKFWGSAYVNDWERMKPYIETLRSDWGERLYVEWEAAVARARDL